MNKHIATALAASALLAMPAFAEDPQIVSDGGTEAVAEAQNSAPVEMGPKFKSASKLLKEAMKAKKWKEGWDENKGRVLVVADADFNCADPAHDKDFFSLREMAVKRAIMLAKSQIAEYVNAKISASEMLDIPGTDVNRELGGEAANIKEELEKQKNELAALAEQSDAAQAAALRDATQQDRVNDLIAATTKKLDEDYDKDASKNDAKAQLADIKTKIADAQKNYDALLKKAEEAKEAVLARQESSVTVQAKLPLFGATVIQQAESFNETSGKYQVAILVCWSKALEESARAIVTGGECKAKPTDLSVQDWLDSKDLATMIGPRQYIDNEGNRWFLGITARLYDEDMNSSARMRNKGLAETFAQQMAVFSVFADVESTKTAQQSLEVRGDANDDYGKEVNAVAESFAQKITQNLERRTVRGLQRLAEEEVTHPITGQDIIVCVYGINAANATAALEIERRNIATLIEANRYQTVEKGRDAANEAAIKESIDRKEDFEAGFGEQTKQIKNELDAREAQRKKDGIRNVQAAPAATGSKGKTTSGSFMGDTDVSDDF